MTTTQPLRENLLAQLRGNGAHITFDEAVANLPPAAQGRVIPVLRHIERPTPPNPTRSRRSPPKPASAPITSYAPSNLRPASPPTNTSAASATPPARLALERTTILTIALDSGFEDLSTFHRAFRAEFQTSPRTFR